MRFKHIILLFFILTSMPAMLFGARRMELVDINYTTAEKFVRLPGVSQKIAEAIIRYRKETGYFGKLEDLINVPEVSEELYKRIEYFLTITPVREIRADILYEELDELQETESTGEIDIDIENLDRYRSNPLDINTATISQFLELPYVTENIAKKIIKYRRDNRGFESIDELKELVSETVYDIIFPFLIVLEEKEIENLYCDMRFRYGVWPYPFGAGYIESDSLYHNPEYFFSRLRMYYGNKAEAGMVLRKDRYSRALTYSNMRDYFIIKQYLLLRNILTMDTVVVGNYSLDFGQGLFIQPSPFLVRRIPAKPRGLREDKGTHFNDKFYGVAGVKRFGSWEVFGFFSEKPMMVSYLNRDGSVGTTPSSFYSYFQTYLSYSSGSHYENFGALTDKLYGGRIKYGLFENLNVGGGYYEQRFDPHIDPAKLVYKGATIGRVPMYLISDFYFRGDRVNLIGCDLEYIYRNLRLFFDWGRSYYHTFDRTVREYDEYEDSDPEWYWNNGDAYQVLAVLSYERASLWVNYHWIEYDYFAFHSSPWTTGLGSEGFDRDEEGYALGGKYKFEILTTQLSFSYGKPIVPAFYYSSLVDDLVQWAAKDQFEVYWDNSLSLINNFTVKFRITYRTKNRTVATGEPTAISDMLGGEDFKLHMPYRVMKYRLELIHEPESNVRLKWRYETVDNAYPEIKRNMYGYMTFGELKYKPTSALTIYTRITYWDAPKGVSAGAMEYTWPNALIPYAYYSVFGAAEKGYRWYIMPTMKFSKKAKLWMKYEYWPRKDKGAKNVFKLQYDFSF